MKHKSSSMAFLLVAGLLAASGAAVQAQITNVLSFTLTVQYQKDSTDNGTVTTYPSPGSKKIASKDLLATMAQDENAEGNYPNTNFPSGAKLVIIDNDFIVLDKTNNFLVDVSDLIQVNGDSDNVLSGKQSDINFDFDGDPLPSTSYTKMNNVYFTFDDTFIPGGNDLSFNLTGLDKETVTATTPKPITGVYTESQSHNITSLVGSGYSDGGYFVITGTCTASGKGTFSL